MTDSIYKLGLKVYVYDAYFFREGIISGFRIDEKGLVYYLEGAYNPFLSENVFDTKEKALQFISSIMQAHISNALEVATHNFCSQYNSLNYIDKQRVKNEQN